MTRTFTPFDLVQLPRVSAHEAHVLATALLTEAQDVEAPAEGEGAPLPRPIARSRDRLRTATEGLGTVLQPRVTPPKEKRKADLAVDNAWSAAESWLDGWRRLPAGRNPHKATAEQLYALCFGEGLAFTKQNYKVEWSESDKRLQALNAAGHRETFAALGGEPFLAEIETTHAAYGDVLGITAPKPTPEETGNLRSHLDALLAALREYVTKVAANVDPDEPGSQALSDRLLGPLSTWDSGGGRPQSDATEPTPSQPPTPTE